jgi:PAS domain S-box-containing protein
MMDILNLANYNLNIYSIPFIPIGIAIIILGISIFLRKPKSYTHVTFLAITLAISIWLIGNAVSFSVVDPEVALFWHKVYWAGVIMIAPSAYSFISSILNLKNIKRHIIIAYCIFIPFLFTLPTNLLISGVKDYYWGYDVVGGILQFPFIIIFGLFMLSLFVLQIMVLRRKNIAKGKRKQIKMLFYGQLIAMLGVFDFLPYLGITYYPIGFIPVFLWVSFIAYAIVKYQLFSITPDIAASTILKTVGDILFVTDVKGKIIITNKVTTKYLNIKKRNIVGNNIMKLIPSTSAFLKKLIDLKDKDDLMLEDEEMNIISKEKEKIPVSVNASIIRGSANSPIGIVVICQDITKYFEAKKARVAALDIANKKSRELGSKVGELQDLKKSMLNVLEDLNIEKAKLGEAKAKDESVLLAIGDGLIVTDKNGTIEMINKAFELMLGWKSKEVIGKKVSDIVPMENEKGKRIPEKERINPLLLIPGKKVIPLRTTYYSTTETYYYVRKDKERFPVTITSTPIILNKKVIGAVEVFRDVTKEKDIDRAKSEFVSLASHQLRTPLSTISWYAEMLLDGDVGKLTDGQEKYLNQVYESNRRMIELVNALLNVSRIEMGTFVIDPEPVKIVDLVLSVLSELKPKIKEKGHTIIKRFDESIPVINADPKLLRIVFQNLLSNAIKYTPQNGKVSLEITYIKKNGTKDARVMDNSILIKVADTGFGIPKSQQDKIFTKLFRADNVKQKETEGTGLGLYIVKSIVEHSGGRVWFESVENKGTTFYVTLPESGMKKKEGTRKLT